MLHKSVVFMSRYKRIIKYLFNEHNILYRSQYSFSKKKHSTNLATIELVTKIIEAAENGEYTVGVFSDLAKAFDTVITMIYY